MAPTPEGTLSCLPGFPTSACVVHAEGRHKTCPYRVGRYASRAGNGGLPLQSYLGELQSWKRSYRTGARGICYHDLLMARSDLPDASIDSEPQALTTEEQLLLSE